MDMVLLLGLLVVLALVVGFGWLLWQMLRQQGRLLLRLETVEARGHGRSCASCRR